jgi:hypothetical protein
MSEDRGKGKSKGQGIEATSFWALDWNEQVGKVSYSKGKFKIK